MTTTKSEWTKGQARPDENIYCIPILDADYHPVAYASGGSMDDPEMNRVASLLVAAPELAEALQSVRDLLAKFPDWPTDMGHTERCDLAERYLPKIDAALAKARGEAGADLD